MRWPYLTNCPGFCLSLCRLLNPGTPNIKQECCRLDLTSGDDDDDDDDDDNGNTACRIYNS